jgi:hypothetical protein
MNGMGTLYDMIRRKLPLSEFRKRSIVPVVEIVNNEHTIEGQPPLSPDLPAAFEESLYGDVVVYRCDNLRPAFNDLLERRGSGINADMESYRIIPPHPRLWVEARSVSAVDGGHLASLTVTDKADPETGWRTSMTILATLDRAMYMHWGCAVFRTDKTGVANFCQLYGRGDYPATSQHAANHLYAFMAFTLGFINCRNIRTVDHVPQRHERRQAARAGAIQPVTYKTLAVTGFGRSEVGRPKSDNHPGVASHIMRGHFKRFTEERPLLGKYVGQFWWEQQVRGTADKGIIHKDYVPMVTP